MSLSLALVLSLADRVSGPAARIDKRTKSLASTIKATQTEIAGLKRQAGGIEQYKRLSAALSENNSKLAASRERVKALRREYAEAAKAGKPLNALKKKMATAGTAVARLSANQQKLRQSTHAARLALKAQGVNTGRLGKESERLAASLDKLNRRAAGLGTLSGRLDSLRALGGKLGAAAAATRKVVASAAIVGVAGLSTIGGIAAVPMRTAAEFERYETILTTIEGSQAKAKKAMAWVGDFAVTTPYQLGQVNDAFVKLRAYGLDPTSGLMKTLGDTSAAMGKPLMQSVEAIADAVTGENERLKEFGIKARTSGDLITYEFSDKAGRSREMSVRKGDRAMIQRTLSTIWNQKYSGAMDRLSKTWEGMLSNVADQWTRFQKLVMDSGPFQRLKDLLRGALAQLDAMAKDGRLKQWADTVGEKILNLIDFVIDFSRATYSTFEAIRPGLSLAANLVGGWGNFAAVLLTVKFTPIIGALKILGSLAFKHPILALVTLLAGGLLLLIKNWDQVSAWLSALPERFANAGRMMIDGLRDGIRDRLQALKDQILALGGMLPAWLKDKLGIQSPSRVFAALGANVSEGLAVGIQQRARVATDAIAKVGRQLPRALPPIIAAGGLAAGPAMAAAPAGGGVVIHATFHITPRPSDDLNAIQAAVTRALAQVQAEAEARVRSRLTDRG
ncbi:MAG: tape measure protein [Gammaproteobacteria bacterium]|nr:tape measure protein [Gammaproteobacteria bacterium]